MLRRGVRQAAVTVKLSYIRQRGAFLAARSLTEVLLRLRIGGSARCIACV